jgi:hypothetical protein
MAAPQFEVGLDGPKLTIPLDSASGGDVDERIKRIRERLDLAAAEMRLSQCNERTFAGLMAQQQALIGKEYLDETELLIAEHDCRSKALFDELAAFSKEIGDV